VEIDRPYQIKRELLEFRRCVSPLCAPLTQLATLDFTPIPEDARPYFRDLSDRVQEVRENIHTTVQAGKPVLGIAPARRVRISY